MNNNQEELIFNSTYKFDIFTVDSKIVMRETYPNPMETFRENLIDTKDKLFIEKLIELGWIPPNENRTCKNCKYFSEELSQCLNFEEVGNIYVKDDFGCNKFKEIEDAREN